MALRNFLSTKTFNWHAYGVQMDAQVTIGATGAPTLVTSSAASSIPTSRGITSITRLTTGTYRVQLDDNYSQFMAMDAFFTAPVTGSDINVDSTTAGLTAGTIYQITSVGTSTTAANWVTLGLPAGVTAAVGQVFKAATTGTGSNTAPGAVKVLGIQAAQAYQMLTTPKGSDTMLNRQPFTQGNGGGYITFQCLAATSAGVTTQIPTDPSNGSTMYLKFYLSNSQVG